jgi:hypothetical protein
MPMLPRSSRGSPRTAPPKPAALDQANGYPDHFRQIAAMVALLDRLPGAAEVGAGRPLYRDAQDFIDGPRRPDDDALRAYDGLDPLTRRAFEAVVAGLDKLSESAADLCDQSHRPLTPVEMEACAAIGISMRQLLQRAAALVESSDWQEADDARAGEGHSSHKLRENKN